MANPGPHNSDPQRRATLVKGAHRWAFRCAAGDESALLTRVAVLAASDEADLDWTDAALIAEQMGRRLTAQAYSFVASGRSAPRRDPEPPTDGHAADR